MTRRNRNGATRSTPEHSHWKTLAREYRSDPRLEAEEIFALPRRFVQMIRRFAPSILQSKDVAFESRLRELSATGFWRQRPFFSGVLEPDPLQAKEYSPDSVSDWKERAEEWFGQLVLEEFSTSTSTTVSTDRREEFRGNLRQHVGLRLKGYVGWLVTDPLFRREVFRFQRMHQVLVQSPADFPRMKDLVLVPKYPGTAPDHIRRFRMDAHQLLDRWVLAGLTTWNLPEPVVPGFLTGDSIPQNNMAPVGFSVFVPWTLLADRSLGLREFADYHTSKADLSHLQEWLGGSTRWGFERFARMLDMYVFYGLALTQRYAARLKGQLGSLDRVFAAYWAPPETAERVIERQVDGARKIRHKLTQRLRACQAAVQEEMERPTNLAPSIDDDDRIEDELAALEREIATDRAGRQRKGRRV